MIENVKQVGILVDVTRCTGCNQCVEACAEANQLGASNFMVQQSPDGLSARRWSSIVESPEGGFVRKFCRHCLEPACVSACPVGAMYRTSEGVVLYDSQKCMGCRYCMMACPFGIPRYEWDSPAPIVQKCTLCYSRLEQGQLPACVETCPEQVLTFGERSELLALANQRLQEAAQTYLPKVYGAHEVGGTAILYISHVPLDFLGYHGAPIEEPMPELTWAWLSKVPAISIGVAGLMTGLFWIIERRTKVELAKKVQMSQQNEEH
ncbi:MAG: 4Fe-4S dicluster domain-containing protein [Anaerolineales bacterium]|jgi:formate dehydrogenase iron-sulfur subunit